ncbi:hypothetical protein DL768_001091 [Monosporascus sp. mg162]|nr:hypothetical protein DL768_001091 [Monosporascus sp. mg162]
MASIRTQTATQKGRPSPAPKHQVTSQDPPAPVQSKGRKRKLSIESALEPSSDPDQEQQTDPIAFWVKEGRWPEEQCWPEENLKAVLAMERLLARKKSLSTPSRVPSISATSVTPSDQRPRGEKSVQYRSQNYEILLATKYSFMGESNLGIADTSKDLCRDLLETRQTVPRDSLFGDDVFGLTCEMIHGRNEARVIHDISGLIVPRAESLATFGANHLKILAESVNEGWNNSIPLTEPRPQPDYSVGFKREAFTKDQLETLAPCIGEFWLGDQSFFMATRYMYFPFLTCEVKCGGMLDVADRQNAHSMTLAVRAIVELFRAVKREGEIHRQILAFSISHDDKSVRIYGHYPVVDGEETMYYRHPIDHFLLTGLNGREKWTAYRFTKNVYDTWMPKHFENICSAIDELQAI